jgi:hypothetical protein
VSAVSAVRYPSIVRQILAFTTAVIALALVVTASPPATASATPTALPTLNWPPPQPVRYAPVLQISEIVANSPNAAGSDAYEYIEVRNASDAPLAWDDFAVKYLYPLVDHTTVASVSWPTLTPGATIGAGDVLVLWVRNEASRGKTVADFNAAYGTALSGGTALVGGKTLVELDGEGLSNSIMRGVEISTRGGVQLSRAYYNEAYDGEDGHADAASKGGVQFGAIEAEGDIQPRIGFGPASPGAVTDDQVGRTVVTLPDAGLPPTIDDLTMTAFTPGKPLGIEAEVRDDALLHTVTVEVDTDLDDPVVRDVPVDELGVARLDLGGADTVGCEEITYRFTATDGYSSVSGEQVTMRSTQSKQELRIGGGHAGKPLDESLTMPVSSVPLTRRDGATVAGSTLLVAGGDEYPPTHTLSVDGAQVDGSPELEHEPIFAFEATLTDPYFRNGVVMDGDVLTVFDEGFFGDTRTVEAAVPLDRVNTGEEFTLRIYSGTKAAPQIDPDEVNDDFVAYNARLALPDGRVIRPLNISDPTELIDVGDNVGSVDYLEATFVVPDDAFTALGYVWDTTAVTDGEHEFAASDGSASTSLRLNVDNTGPELTPSIAPGSKVRGDQVFDAVATDDLAGVGDVTATLDGRAVRLPFDVSSITGEPGDHVATITATDRAGNATNMRVPYSIPQEAPTVSTASTVSTAGSTGAAGAGGASTVTATVDDASGDKLDVTIARGSALQMGTDVRVSVGEATEALAVDRPDARVLTAAEAAALGSLDGTTVEAGSDAKLPYVLIDADVPDDAEGQVHIQWEGSANANAKALLYVLDPATHAWVEVDRHVTASDTTASDTFTLDAKVPVATYAADGQVRALVQHSEGFAADNRSTRDTVIEPNHPDDTPRDAYDFTLAWESDTQYYNARANIYDRQTSIHDYVLGARDDINLQYLIHTGDIVDWSGEEAQWERADAAYEDLDQAGLPYGVLAGNHDVNQRTNDYTDFSRLFGDERFAANPWFGESYEDNRGHYDLITAGGIDFLFLYMGWGAGDAEIDWMNDVLAQYPERVAVVNVHEFMLTTGGLGPLPQRIYDEVVATNANVRFVLCGHYHDAFTRTDGFDDDGDGTKERTVTSMLFDYQDLANGGDGYLRLLQFDNQEQAMTVRTYSDYLKDYDAVNAALDQAHQEFVVPYAQADIQVTRKALVTDAIRVDVLSDDVIASFEGVAAGSAVDAEWSPPAGAGEWYVRAVDPYGAEAVTDVRGSTPAGAQLTSAGR